MPATATAMVMAMATGTLIPTSSLPAVFDD